MIRTLVTMKLAIALAFGMVIVPNTKAADFEIDNGHSAIMFNVVHFGVAKAYGRFNKFSGTVSFDEANPTATSIDLTILTDSVDTDNERRDKHLRNADFFNAVQFPEVTFKSTGVEMDGDTMIVKGELTMLGTTKPVTATMNTMGSFDHPRGGTLRGFFGKTTIKRSDFGMNYGIENGALANEVEIIFSFEAKAQ